MLIKRILKFPFFAFNTIFRCFTRSSRSKENPNEVSPIEIGFVVFFIQVYFSYGSGFTDWHPFFISRSLETLLFICFLIIIAYDFFKTKRQKTIVAILFIALHVTLNIFQVSLYELYWPSVIRVIDIIFVIVTIPYIYLLMAWKFDYKLIYKSLTKSENIDAPEVRGWIKIRIIIYILIASLPTFTGNSLHLLVALVISNYLVSASKPEKIVHPDSIEKQPVINEPTLWDKLNVQERARQQARSKSVVKTGSSNQ